MSEMKVEMGRTYRTRDGREVRIYAVDGLGNREVHGAIYTPKDGWEHRAWFPDGMMYTYPSGADLVEVRPRIKREVWVNLYPNGVNAMRSREQADDCACDTRIACVRVEIDVEEGHGLE